MYSVQWKCRSAWYNHIEYWGLRKDEIVKQETESILNIEMNE